MLKQGTPAESVHDELPPDITPNGDSIQTATPRELLAALETKLAHECNQLERRKLEVEAHEECLATDRERLVGFSQEKFIALSNDGTDEILELIQPEPEEAGLGTTTTGARWCIKCVDKVPRHPEASAGRASRTRDQGCGVGHARPRTGQAGQFLRQDAPRGIGRRRQTLTFKIVLLLDNVINSVTLSALAAPACTGSVTLIKG